LKVGGNFLDRGSRREEPRHIFFGANQLGKQLGWGEKICMKKTCFRFASKKTQILLSQGGGKTGGQGKKWSQLKRENPYWVKQGTAEEGVFPVQLNRRNRPRQRKSGGKRSSAFKNTPNVRPGKGGNGKKTIRTKGVYRF